MAEILQPYHLISYPQPLDFPDRWVFREKNRCICFKVYNSDFGDIRVSCRVLDIDCVESFGSPLIGNRRRTT